MPKRSRKSMNNNNKTKSAKKSKTKAKVTVPSKKSKTNLVCFEPLKLSEITASYNNKSSLQIIRQIALTENSNYKKINIPANFISMFIAEVLTRTIKENLADHNLFDFIFCFA